MELTIDTANNIEQVFEEQLDTLLSLRDQVILQLRQSESLTQADKDAIIELSHYEETIVGRMDFLKEEASRELTRLRNSQMNKSKYDQVMAAESYFIDRKE
ncbi:hypothetical protein AB4Z33_08095 [Paenibacillus sp. 2TAB19]